MRMTKIMILISGILLLNIFLVAAYEDFNETKQLIDSGISCDNLTNEQLETIGDYYMEQMHPDEAHEYMDKMMGGEGSESLKQMHINMAKSFYCNENVGMENMMNMMASGNGMMSSEMMNSNMMGGNMMNSGDMMGGNMMAGGGMMGNSYYQITPNNPYKNNFLGFQIFFYIIQVLIIVILILMIMLSINKLKNNVKKGGNKKHGRQ